MSYSLQSATSNSVPFVSMDSVLNLTLCETLQDARWLTEPLPLPFYTSFTWGVSAGDARHVLYIISCPLIQSEEFCRSLQKFAAVLLSQVGVPVSFLFAS